MEEIKHKIASWKGPVTFKSLKEFIDGLDQSDIDYENWLTDPQSPGDYGRTILTLEPFECVLIHWPAGVGSAVHLHEGLFGYVWILEGDLDNIFFQHREDQLIEKNSTRYVKGGLIPEPDGVIHKLQNPTNKRAVSLHFYYPAIESFDGMKLFDLDSGSIGELSDQAQTASWNTTPGHFKEVSEKAFQFTSFAEWNSAKSHVMVNVIPKPEPNRIREMNGAYFSEQAHRYDFSDFNQPSRQRYVSQVDQLVAEYLGSLPKVNDVLDIAVGTGRRALSIREMSKQPYTIHGVDISDEMCAIATDRGIDVHNQDWVHGAEIDVEPLDAITFLYAFGHLANRETRMAAVQRVYRYLKPGGLFFLDLFSLRNVNEWGPRAMERYENSHLDQQGYERGDVFYRKTGLQEIAFVHYFTREEALNLLAENGFELVKMHCIGYAKNPGELVESEEKGNMFIVARKSS
ncbi:MAG: methyltransferase domain-containing protein [Flavobacteriales bacterium]|nr:methyltransferase domain-containing protein [Bacteroidota bacterium]MCB9240066.1 methyltransferase domain-containing protein [Flavobacteriales bacterium]